MKNRLARSATRVCGVLLAGFPALASAALRFNLQPPATKAAQEVYDMHLAMMAVIVVIFVGVFGVMFYSIFAHRKSKGHQAAQFHENTTVEILWTAIPIVILMFMAWPATKVLLTLRNASNPDITIKVTGYQWKWGYDYLKGEGRGISFLSQLSTPQAEIENKEPKDPHYLLEVDHPMVVPVGKKIKILVTAADVIHSWFVPAFGVKQDAFPGYLRTTWFKADRVGTFRGQCAELCGKNHGFMPIVVRVVSAQKYTAWVAKQKKRMAALSENPNKVWTFAALKARGAKVYSHNCAACHQPNGRGVKGAFPALDGSKIVNGPKKAQIRLELYGRPGTAMAAFGKQLSDTDLAAVITYTRNSWGNKTGEVIQPAEVKAQRK